MTDPVQYNLHDSGSEESATLTIAEFDEELTKMSGKCMDIGCGPGDITKNILLPALHPNAVLIGTDISEDMVIYANKTYSDDTRLKFDVLDIETRRLPKKYISEFDHVFSFYALQWCNNIKLTFENIYHLLRPGGTILISIILYHDIFDILHKMSQDNRYTSYVMHMTNFIPPLYDLVHPRKELKALLRSIGFNILHCSRREKTYTAQEVQNLPPLILSFLTQFLKDMPYDLMEQFKDELTQEYTRSRFQHKQIRNQNERIASDIYEILIVYARKAFGR